MPLFDIDPWKLIERGFHPEHMRLSESLTSLGNGSMGMRGNFEERYSGDSHRGTYLGGVWFPDKTRVGWWKNGYPKYFGKVINAVNMIGVNVAVDGVEIDLAQLPVLDFERELDMRTGTLRRRAVVRHPKGEVRIECERFLSIEDRRILAIRYRVTPSFLAEVALTAYLDGNVRNEDANYEELFWDTLEQGQAEDSGFVSVKTRENPFDVPRFAACAAMHARFSGATITHWEPRPAYAGMRLTKRVLSGRGAELEKLVAVVTSRDCEEKDLKKHALNALNAARAKGYPQLYAEHENAWVARWEGADVAIRGDDAAQQGIRFNIFQLFCTYDGSDARLNIGPKGFTGEKYGGATYWDTEAYCLPMYLSIAPEEVARNLLLYRYHQLPGAYHNARAQGLDGALYPMVTFNGIECHNEWEITFEEIHRNAAIAHAVFQYETYTGDEAYVRDYGFDVVLAIARFWVSRVHFSTRVGKYMIHGVTGPNEYENNVNNNWYTNRMAAWCLTYACDIARRFKPRWKALNLTQGEVKNFEKIAAEMYLPEDSALGIFVAHDTFLDKDLMPASAIDPADRPINQHWSWDRILRSCFIKQADTLQGLYALGHLYDLETKKRNFDFYEPMTVHESSLSPCVHAILAAEIGDIDKAVEMYRRTARLDLDNLNHDTQDGCHITSMAGSYLAISRGFAGMRTVAGLSFRPVLPPEWSGYGFKLRYRGRVIEIDVAERGVRLRLVSGERVPLRLYDEPILLDGEAVRDLENAR
jgi:maltose phosphorylase